MNTKTKNIYLNYILLFSITILFAGCSIDGFEGESSELTDEELEIATEIIGESLSDQNEGIFSSLNDAFVIPSESGFQEQALTTGGDSHLLSSMAQDSSGSNQNERNFSYSYDPETGIHSVSFNRILNRPLITKESSAELEYIFYDINGEFIESPRMENERVETVDYSAERTGSITTPRRTSAYQRSDLFVTDGLSATSGTIQIDGLHQGSGQFEATRQNGDSITREYEISVDFLNVQIDKQLMEQTNSLQRGVTGSVAYEMTISRAINGDESTKTVNGTIELNGDGTALLRFRNVLDIFRIKLDDGSVFDDDEFEGFVRSLNRDNQSFTLFSGQTIFITGQTEVEFEDGLSSFQDIQRSLQNGVRVKAEGSLIRRDDDNSTAAATEVEFEIESSDDDGDGDDGREFEGVVESVDASLDRFSLRNGLTLYVTESTEIDSDSDISSMQDLRDAVNRGLKVEADGEYTVTGDDRLVVLDVEFEFDD